MKSFIRTTMLATILLVGGSAIAAQISVGIQIGPPPRPRVVRVVPKSPGPEYVRVDGYWYPEGKKYKWHDGYWTRPPYVGAHWVAPHHDGKQYFVGYWDGAHGQMEHDHHSDRGKVRDYHAEPERR